MLYFGQPGCPYCKQLMEVNFRQRPIVERMQKEFVVDRAQPLRRPRDHLDRRPRDDGEEARRAAQGAIHADAHLPGRERRHRASRERLLPPARFLAALDQAWGRPPSPVERRRQGPDGGEPFFLPLKDLRRKRPLAVRVRNAVLRRVRGAPCERVPASGGARELEKYDVVRFALSGADVITTPAGRQTKVADWARSLKIDYVPTIVLFDAQGSERLRMEAYFRAFHVAGSLAYVSSGAWRREPSFQRFLQARGERHAPSGKARGPVGLAGAG